MSKAEAKKPNTPLSGPSTGKPRGEEQTVADFNTTVRKAEGGDKTALAKVREMLVVPGMADNLSGNVAREALRLLVKIATGDNPVIREATERKFEQMREELLGPNPTALERLLVERIIAAWFHLHHLEALYASRTQCTFASGLYYQKCISAAQKRYLAAIKGLSDVRKLALPALQVNIAKKQINVAGGTAG